MWATSNPAQFEDAIRAPHARLTTITFKNLVSGAVSDPLPLESGQVVDDATSNVRRNLTCSLSPSQDLWDTLDTVGGELTVTQTLRYVDGSTEVVPMGVFILDADSFGYAPGDTLDVTAAPDRWGKVQKNKLAPSARASVPSNTVWQEIKRLVEGAWNSAYPFPGWASIDTTVTTKVGQLLWDDGDREAAILELCKGSSLEVLFNRSGLGIIRQVPVLTSSSTPVWMVDAAEDGIMVSASRTRDRTSIANVLVVSTTATDVTFSPVEVKNTTSGDPLSVNGPLGYQAQEWSSPTIRNSTQAAAAGRTQLLKTLGVAKQLSLGSVSNFALDSADVITVQLPQVDRNTPRPTELHIVDSVTHPLAPGDPQTLLTRSTRPSTDGT